MWPVGLTSFLLNEKKTVNLLCPFQKAFGIEVQARSWASSKFAPTYQSPGHGREPKQEIFLRIQESSQILLDQKPQRQRDIGLVPFDLARHQTHGLYLELVKEWVVKQYKIITLNLQILPISSAILWSARSYSYFKIKWQKTKNNKASLYFVFITKK